MRIGIVDADLIGRKKHRFPNLACMKISGFHKDIGDSVDLLTDYDSIRMYDKVYISKVFTDTPVPDGILSLDNVSYGGTGFFYDKSPKLEHDVEHHFPDYHLYDKYVEGKTLGGGSKKEFQFYTDFSIGFTTRGCIRGCSFCVNKNYRSCNVHSPLSEFVDNDRKYICLLDDNVLACRDWRSIFDALNKTGKRFQFKQGMDERLLTDEKCEVIFNSAWYGDYIFAFDNIKDKDVVENKLKMIRRHTDKVPKFYCFCGYNHNSPDTYDDEFWRNDIRDLFERIEILFRYNALPYIMRYKDYEKSEFRGLYVAIAAWCNQPRFAKKLSFNEFCLANYERNHREIKRYADYFAEKNPDIAHRYYDIKFGFC